MKKHSTIWPIWPNDWAVFWVLICTVELTVCSFHVTYAFQSESAHYNCLNVKDILGQSRRVMWSLSDCNWNLTQNHLLRKRTLNHVAKRLKWLSCVVSAYLYGAIDCIFLSCQHVFQRKYPLYNCFNVKELLSRSRHVMWNLNDFNYTWTQNQLVRKETLNHLAKLTKWMSCVLRTYLYGAIDCIFLSCYKRISEWIHPL